MTVRIIRITDEALPTWNDDLKVAQGTVGEIVAQGPVVTSAYYNRATSTALAKIADPATGGFYHRMGDLGYFDEQGRLWFCGRKSQRVVTANGTLFTIPCEGVFNAHPAVARTALVAVERNGTIEPILCVERDPGTKMDANKLRQELLALGTQRAYKRDKKDPLSPIVSRRHSAQCQDFSREISALGRQRNRVAREGLNGSGLGCILNLRSHGTRRDDSWRNILRSAKDSKYRQRCRYLESYVFPIKHVVSKPKI